LTGVARLLARARALDGVTLGEVAAAHGVGVPADLRRRKGWVGELIERELGVENAGAGPDFPELGVELKTVPVDAAGAPLESTWVGVVDLESRDWSRSRTRAKLTRVLFVPVSGRGAPGGRVIGRAVLWEPDPVDEQVLRTDWEEHVEVLALGEHWQVDARRGVALQMRPKAARGADTHWTLDDEGEWARTQPKGFYLRRAFVRRILAGGASPVDRGASPD
jgi:DNA mismatch repair protein MutH